MYKKLLLLLLGFFLFSFTELTNTVIETSQILKVNVNTKCKYEIIIEDKSVENNTDSSSKKLIFKEKTQIGIVKVIM